MEEKEVVSKNFIELAIDKDLAEGVYDHVCTRFPPEPNGYLHIGHAKSILLNYGLSQEYNGEFHMRFDDTNPTKEKTEFVDSIKADIQWLGADWKDHLYYASDYFPQMYEAAVKLIKKGKAFVCDLSAEEIREYRGTLTEPGKESPYRNRSVEENLDLFERMKNGEFEDGSKVLRAKIDMASPNINMRDPVIYRVAHMHHHRTGDTWCIYPMYDFAHPIEDAIEGITHSICTLEFEDHRPLYDWVVRELEYPMPPRQIEFAKLYLTNVVTGKRYIKKLVEDGVVDGWDDPRLVSIAALRRRGFTPESIKKFVDLCGVSKANSSVDYAMLEYCIREDLKLKKARTMAVLNPVKLVIDNYPEDQIEMLEVQNNLENPELGSRQVPFGRELYIEREDFMEEPVRKYFRMFPGNEVRLMNAYFVTCTGCEKDENGNITVIHGTYDPESKGGNSPDGRKVKGTIHWVAAKTAVKAECRLYENLIDEEKGVYNEDGSMNLNPNSLIVLKECYLEPSLKDAKAYDSFQFVRNGFFCVDAKDSKEDALVFNRIVSLKSSFKLPAAK
ncbi:glutamine--tRNA ligase/YqeY domain fusion protein [Fusicatenibacter saccharivorans]|uniref:glutamine--tRNA ligase/YqeY domain fusion protein n=1 Tax=Fusicatenibacter saccharivorans TaxID=1150298 RepID=UPI00156F5662|nr:glutamine--tRNA ligase/YqeY domain fusion protein [Fusicatenibacter saccharivorans]MCB5526808.1 glutamine--tRNA ligase/YqeY domain fusion protein [Fusicatenibacter saccharivorans]MCB5672824.1 glutamine--tRNA ligase/YqeY domain fusion protein [Fusicatenibacter saccharivorans]MCB5691994.1 glutamine--tRNA ligase/YqeY domain fusion protein [Fusicatenibacter saccharivorans]MCB5695645.1 glutamine--tRNA ligase/YqeY domain fusion protein [Fusicatenibacter saccharivorans]MCC2731176.1 glutamine--tRNA